MFGRTMMAGALAAGLLLPAPAAAQPFGYVVPDHYRPVRDRDDRRRQERRWTEAGREDRRGYDRRAYRGRCRDRGTGGTIIGAIAGGLLGDAAVGRRGDGTAGAIVGAGVGALAGRAIDRDC